MIEPRRHLPHPARMPSITTESMLLLPHGPLTVEWRRSPRARRVSLPIDPRGGRVVLIGLQPTGDQPVPISLAISRELELAGAFRFNDEIDEVISEVYEDVNNGVFWRADVLLAPGDGAAAGAGLRGRARGGAPAAHGPQPAILGAGGGNDAAPEGGDEMA